jgi:hypothetical protein
MTAFLAILGKAADHAATRKFDPKVYLSLRLRPDMMPFSRQVQTFCDNAKNASARLAGVQAPVMEDTETTIEELRARIEKTLAFIKTLDKTAIEAAGEREVVFPAGRDIKGKMRGADYLIHYSLPNYYFHLTTAYDLLRYAGVEIGKRDYLGAVPGFSFV